MSFIDQALAGNDRFAAAYGRRELPPRPAVKLAVVTCMDARFHVEPALGLQLGDANVIRNAGGRIADAIRSLVVSQALLGTEEVAIIHHTDCGMTTFTDESIRAKLRNEQGADADALAFLPFTDLEQSVKDDIRLYMDSPLVRHDIPVRGFIYDVTTGRLHEVTV